MSSIEEVFPGFKKSYNINRKKQYEAKKKICPTCKLTAIGKCNCEECRGSYHCEKGSNCCLKY